MIVLTVIIRTSDQLLLLPPNTVGAIF